MKGVAYHYDIETGEALDYTRSQLIKLNFKKKAHEKSYNYERDEIIHRTGWERPRAEQLKLF